MKLTLKLKLKTSQEELKKLSDTVQKFSEASNQVSLLIKESNIKNHVILHRLYYYQIKSQFDLPAQMTCNALKRALFAYKSGNKKTTITFKQNASMPFDDRMLSFKNNQVSILTLNGRIKLNLIIYGAKAQELLNNRKGESILVIKNNKAFLHIIYDAPEATQLIPNNFLGVDFGIVNIATTSEGQMFSGSYVDKVRSKYQNLKSSLQKKETRSSYRKLKKISGRQARFVKNINHVISKTIVQRAKALDFGIALEELSKIKTPVKKAQQLRHDQWSFFQLRKFFEYKSALLGVPLVFVDPRNTSRECPKCHHTEKKNRKTQDTFVCLKCNYSANADCNAAINIAARASINRLNVANLNKVQLQTQRSLIAE